MTKLQAIAPFEVKPDVTYYIKEKPTEDTADELRKHGRSKRGAGFIESAGCPYDDYNKRYLHGLDTYSKDYNGLTSSEKTKLTSSRKKLRNELDSLTRNDADKETEVIAGLKLILRHDMAINTANPTEFLRLYLAMRGSVITPPNQMDNYGKYGQSMYVLVDQQESESNKDKHSKMVFKVTSSLTTWLANEESKAWEYLRFANLLGPNEEKEPHYLLETITKLINTDYKQLVRMYDLITETDYQDILAYNRVREKYLNGKIKKEVEGYTFEGEFLGLDLKVIARKLRKDPDLKSLLLKIVGEE